MSADSSEPAHLRDLIAANLQRLRLDAGVAAADVVRAARGFGIEWTEAWIAGVERGTRPISAEHLLGLLVVYTDAVGHRVTLADLLDGNRQVLLAQSESSPKPVAASYLRDLVTGSPFRRAFGARTAVATHTVAEPSPGARAAERLHEIARAGFGMVDMRAFARAEAGAGELEAKLARKLAVPVTSVIAAAASLWGHSLTEERAARLVGDDAPAPAPALLMRRLTSELTLRISDATAEAAEAAALEAMAAEARQID